MHLLGHSGLEEGDQQVGGQGAKDRGQDKGRSYLHMRPANSKHLKSFVYMQHEKKKNKKIKKLWIKVSLWSSDKRVALL